MRVRDATLEDKSAWDSFVDGEGGSFSLYFDWKYVHEAGGGQFIPLLVETAPSQLIAILPMVKQNRLLYSTLDSGRGGGAQGLLLKRGLSDNDRNEATSGFWSTLTLFALGDVRPSHWRKRLRLSATRATSPRLPYSTRDSGSDTIGPPVCPATSLCD